MSYEDSYVKIQFLLCTFRKIKYSKLYFKIIVLNLRNSINFYIILLYSFLNR